MIGIAVGVRICERKNELVAINPRLSTFRPGRPAPGYADHPRGASSGTGILAALAADRKDSAVFLYQRTLFVGCPIFDESRVRLISEVNRRAALLAFEIALEAKADEIRACLIVWKDFPESSSAEMNWLSQQRRLFRVISLPNTIVELPSRRKEDYFAALKRSRRQNLKRKLKRSREQVTLSVEIVQRPDAKTLDAIFNLFWQTYENRRRNLKGSLGSFLKFLLKNRPPFLSSSGKTSPAR